MRHFSIAWAERRILQKQLVAALWVLLAVLYIHPDAGAASSANTHFFKGSDYLTNGMWDEAIAEFTKAIGINPRYADSYCNMFPHTLEQL